MDGKLCYGPRKYIIKLIDQYEKFFGYKPREYASSLEKGDQPEIDQTEELDKNGIKLYQTMIDCLQWAESFGWFDIQTANDFVAIPCCPKKRYLRAAHVYVWITKAFGPRNQTSVPFPTKILFGVMLSMGK
jgi:hypothetical protein